MYVLADLSCSTRHVKSPAHCTVKFEGPWFTTQILLSSTIGIVSFLVFSYCRPRWPLLFAPRTKLKGQWHRSHVRRVAFIPVRVFPTRSSFTFCLWMDITHSPHFRVHNPPNRRIRCSCGEPYFCILRMTFHADPSCSASTRHPSTCSLCAPSLQRSF